MSDIILLRVDGMTCGHCTTAVERAVAAVAGVETVQVQLEPGLAEVTLQGGGVNNAAAAAAVVAAI